MDRVGAVAPGFEVEHRDAGGAARAGRLATSHGALLTPAFLPVGTYGSVRGLTPQDLIEVGTQGLLTNTYHLHLRPGEQRVADLGGLHRFMGWDGPILTDSGGYQVYSLDRFAKRDEDGVSFRSPVDGSLARLTPESCIAIQAALGADLIVTLDEFEPIGTATDSSEAHEVRNQMERTLRWAERCRDAHARPDQLLFGIVQGGGFGDLRAESAERTAALGFDAFAIGGLGVGESELLRCDLVERVVAVLPEPAPRYLMGIGFPQDLIDAVARGVDLFDCVIPTRHGRHGSVFTREGPLNLRNARFRDDPGPLDASCACPVCARFSRAYLRHLLDAGELLAPRLLSWHNLAHYLSLLREARTAILENRFEEWRSAWPKPTRAGEAQEHSSG